MNSPITTHVLDTAIGRPACGLHVTLDKKSADQWRSLASGKTNNDGRIVDLLEPGSLEAGHYRLTFKTGEYFAAQKVVGFYPQVQIEFEIHDVAQHYHVPLLLNPFGYSTYRGS